MKLTKNERQHLNGILRNMKRTRDFLLKDETIIANVLTVSGNSIVTIIPEKVLSLTISNIAVAFGSSISADMKGYAPYQGPGAGGGANSAGASYGGVGYGNSLTSTYGSETNPTDLGSGGATRGGGSIQLVVSGTLQNDGIISAGGNASGSGGTVRRGNFN